MRFPPAAERSAEETERLWVNRLQDWRSAPEELKKFPKGLCRIYDAPEPRGARIPAGARAEGLEKPGR